MAIPELTNSARRAALNKAVVARRIRAEVKRRLADGEVTLAEVLELADNDDVVARTRVLAVLEALPRVGKKTARRTMEQLDISESRRLRGLGKRQRERLLAEFDEK